MSSAKVIQMILNGTVHSIRSVIPMSVEVGSPTVKKEPYIQEEMGVLIGIVGGIKGRIIIDGSPSIFGKIGASMFGMELTGEMLESFTGELGNMIAGNLCTYTANEGLELDITPPTVMVGTTKLYGFQQAFCIPATIESVGTINILYTIDEE